MPAMQTRTGLAAPALRILGAAPQASRAQPPPIADLALVPALALDADLDHSDSDLALAFTAPT